MTEYVLLGPDVDIAEEREGEDNTILVGLGVSVVSQ